MLERIESMLQRRVGTANIIAVILSLGYVYITCFTVTYITAFGNSISKEALDSIEKLVPSMREVVMVIIAYVIGNSRRNQSSR